MYMLSTGLGTRHGRSAVQCMYIGLGMGHDRSTVHWSENGTRQVCSTVYKVYMYMYFNAEDIPYQS